MRFVLILYSRIGIHDGNCYIIQYDSLQGVMVHYGPCGPNKTISSNTTTLPLGIIHLVCPQYKIFQKTNICYTLIRRVHIRG